MDDNPAPSSTESNTQLAGQACSNCKGSKKKCDRTLPSCSRCVRQSIACTYDVHSSRSAIARLESKLDEVYARLDRLESSILNTRNGDSEMLTVAPSEPAAPYQHCDGDQDRDGDTDAPKWELNSSLLSCQMNCLLLNSMGQILQENLSTEKQVLEKYLQTVHQWLPIVPSADVLRAVDSEEHDELNTGCALLILSMFLVTEKQSHTASAVWNTERVYRTCKNQFVTFLSSGETSLYAVQAGVLITLFEYTQDLIDDAYTTLGICARTAHMQGFHQLRPSSLSTQKDVAVQIGAQHKTWWAIVMLERYINTPVFEKPRQPMITATENEMTLIDVPEAAVFSSPADLFTLEAEAVTLLSKVHEFMREHGANDSLPFRQALDIDRGLTALLCKLQLRQYCAIPFRYCFASLTCASILLHTLCLCKAKAMGEKSYIEISMISLQDNLFGSTAAVKPMLAAISKGTVAIESINPFWSRVALQAELTQRAIIEDPTQRHTLFVELLQVLSSRYKIAESFLRLLCNSHHHTEHDASSQH
ncbi:transcriptional regulator family: Fungal Specific TF [Paecilomyces variotii]|nr:transcriptional regulator family: Fungal Specific TF [Paecilomyces variotii]